MFEIYSISKEENVKYCVKERTNNWMLEMLSTIHTIVNYEMYAQSVYYF